MARVLRQRAGNRRGNLDGCRIGLPRRAGYRLGSIGNTHTRRVALLACIYYLLYAKTDAKRAHRRAVAVGSCHKRQRRKRQSVTAKREKSQTPKFPNALLT